MRHALPGRGKGRLEPTRRPGRQRPPHPAACGLSPQTQPTSVTELKASGEDAHGACWGCRTSSGEPQSLPLRRRFCPLGQSSQGFTMSSHRCPNFSAFISNSKYRCCNPHEWVSLGTVPISNLVKVSGGQSLGGRSPHTAAEVAGSGLSLPPLARLLSPGRFCSALPS